MNPNFTFPQSINNTALTNGLCSQSTSFFALTKVLCAFTTILCAIIAAIIAAMWLINCSNYRLEPNDLESSQPKPYWILSHTWGDDEVSFQDIQCLRYATGKRGFGKIHSMCKLALASGIKYVCVDTCCIDKTSSAELSEAINSMFYWYSKSERCIAFLEDPRPGAGNATEDELRGCRWFTRGWTLQELLAPRKVDFYDSQWNSRGTKNELCQVLSNITNIRNDILGHSGGVNDLAMQTVSVATKMSWAAGRQTTRIEDRAYCLLGIFDVHMPLLYGERRQAFIRLQHAIAQKDSDMSLFAWIAMPDYAVVGASDAYSGLLARDPSQFALCPEIVPIRDALLPVPSWIITNTGIETTTALSGSFFARHTIVSRRSDGTVKVESRASNNYRFCHRLFLHCRIRDQDETGEPASLAIWLRKTSSGYVRFWPTELCSVKTSAMEFSDPSCIRISTSLTSEQHQEALESVCLVRDISYLANTLQIWWDIRRCDAQVQRTYHPTHLWDRGRFRFPRWVDSPLLGNLGIGLVEITISNQAGGVPFSQTCWMFCGIRLASPGPQDNVSYCLRPWVELVCEEPDGRVPMLGKQAVCLTRNLRNPFALSSVLAKLQASGVRPEFNSLQTECIVKCAPALHMRIWASDFTTADRRDVTQEPRVTISGEAFDPTVDVSLEHSMNQPNHVVHVARRP